MKLLDDLKPLDECLVSVAMREDGFVEVVGVHRPYAINKKLRELGYHRIATKPCECQDKARIANMPAQVAATRRRSSIRLKYHAKRNPQGARLPVSKTPDSV